MSQNNSLNFQLPKNVLTEDIPLWHDFYAYLDELYSFNELSKNEATQLAKDFYSLSRERKMSSLGNIYKYLIARSDQRPIENETISDWIMAESAENMVYGLPPEEKQEFYNFVGGEDTSEEEAAEYQTLDLGVSSPSAAMTPEQIEKRFATSPQNPFQNINNGIASDTKIADKKSDSPIKIPNIPNTQPHQNPSQQSNSQPANPAQSYTKKTNTLEDLL